MLVAIGAAAVLALVGYIYYHRHNTRAGKTVREDVRRALERNGCQVRGDNVTCSADASFAGLGQNFTLTQAVDKVQALIASELNAAPMPQGGGPPQYAPPPPQQQQQYHGPPPPQAPRGPPEPITTNPKRAAMGGGGGGGAPGMPPPPNAGGGDFMPSGGPFDASPMGGPPGGQP